jgi:hypothetical protein
MHHMHHMQQLHWQQLPAAKCACNSTLQTVVAVRHLYSNAIKFTDAGSIEVEVSHSYS